VVLLCRARSWMPYSCLPSVSPYTMLLLAERVSDRHAPACRASRRSTAPAASAKAATYQSVPIMPRTINQLKYAN
jgi:hypothetical protein